MTPHNFFSFSEDERGNDLVYQFIQSLGGNEFVIYNNNNFTLFTKYERGKYNSYLLRTGKSSICLIFEWNRFDIVPSLRTENRPNLRNF